MNSYPHRYTHMGIQLVLGELTEGWISGAWFVLAGLTLVSIWVDEWRDRKQKRKRVKKAPRHVEVTIRADTTEFERQMRKVSAGLARWERRQNSRHDGQHKTGDDDA